MQLKLYLIEILHQTTTSSYSHWCDFRLYLIEILHQTTTNKKEDVITSPLYLIEILHQTTTSYANWQKQFELYLIEILHQTTTVTPIYIIPGGLYLIEILHQTTTWQAEGQNAKRCILSKFYIKPQLPYSAIQTHTVVSYRNSTSNHNFLKSAGNATALYLIEILHQTTTSLFCYTNTYCCILSKFYIKPQLCP